MSQALKTATTTSTQPTTRPTARIVSLRQVLRDNITAESLRATADSQKRHTTGKAQRDRLRRLAAHVEQERGW
jgi:hypothetical protein